MMTLPRDCQVCGYPAIGFHFGIASCKACSAFFRRSVAESKTYLCLSSNDCDMFQDRRNQCRACRLRKCHQLGMRRDKTVPPPPRVEAVGVGKVTPPLSPGADQGQTGCESLSRMAQLHQTFLTSQKSLFHIISDQTAITGQADDLTFKQATIEDFNRMETGSATLISSILDDYFPFLKDADRHVKNAFFVSFASRFTYFHKAWMTYTYVDKATEHIALHYGYSCRCTVDDAKKFYGDMDLLEEVVSVIKPFSGLVKKTSLKMGEMGLTNVEVGGVVGSIFYSQLSSTEMWDKQRTAEYDELTVAFHNYCLDRYGPVQGGLRFSRMLSLLLDLENMESTGTNMQILSGFLVADGKQFIDSFAHASKSD